MKSNVVMIEVLVLLVGLIGSDCACNNNNANGGFFDFHRRRQDQLVEKSQTVAALPAPVGADQINLRVSDVIATNVLRFAQNIGQQLSTGEYRNEIFSPVSLMTALAFLLLGAKGKSHQELQQLFSGNNDEELHNYPYRLHEQLSYMLNDLQQSDVHNISPGRGEDPWRHTVAVDERNYRRNDDNKTLGDQILNIANGVFIQTGYTLNRDYSEVIRSVYRSKLSQLDFLGDPSKARSHINDWVSLNTHGKIPKVIDGQLDRNTNIIMASVLYFKAFWLRTFVEGATRIGDFFIDGVDRPPTKANLMATLGIFPYYNSSEYGCEIIGLPYRGNLTTMYVIKPHQSSRAKLRQMQSYLDANKIEDMISRMTRKSALVVFPKMHLTSSLNMKSVLQSMNVSDVFWPGKSDLSLIGICRDMSPSQLRNDDDKPISSDQLESALQRVDAERVKPATAGSDLFVEEIIHKVDFNVNEKGTEAAAATVTTFTKSGPRVEFRANAPFMLLLRHDPTKLILFYGIINEPPVDPLTS